MKIKPWKVINQKVIHQTPWIRVKEDLCEVDSQKLTYTYVERSDAGPLIIPEEVDGRLWMVQQYRHPIKRVIWQFPAEGKLENESWEAAAIRGLEEEIGKTTKTLVNLSLFYPDPGMLEQKSYFFLATKLYNLKFNSSESTEVEELEPKLFTLEEIDQMINKGEICDSWTISALYHYKKYKKLF